jgi:hypothetical protein
MKKNLLLFVIAINIYGAETVNWYQGNIPETNIVEMNPAQISLPGNQAEIFISASFLYWVVKNDFDIYSLSTDRANFTTAHLNEYQFEPNFNFRPGVQVTLGANFNHKWHIFAEWTYVNGRSSGHADAPNGGSLNAVEYNSKRSLGDSVQDASSYGHTRYQTVDLLVGRPYYLEKRLILKPFFGLRSAFIRITNRNTYEDIDLTFFNAAGGIQTTNGEWRVDDFLSKTWSIGLKAGTTADCLLGRGFKFYGTVDISLLWTHLNNSFVERLSDDLNNFFGTGPIFCSSALKTNGIRSNIHLGGGSGWGIYFGKSCHLDILLGYDFSLWINYMRWKFTNSDLFLHGLTLSTRVDF